MDRDRFKNVAFKIGTAEQISALDILENLTKHHKIRHICTDKNPVYSSVMRYFGQEFEIKHHITKAETCLVEAFNSSLRDMLARLNRKTKRFSKCKEMLQLTIQMFYNKKLSYKIYV